jgi:hypothetical protein
MPDALAVVQLTQQWLVVDGNSKNLVVAQSHKASTGLLYMLEYRRQAPMLMKHGCVSKERARGQRKSFLFLCPYTDFQQKLWPRLKVCLSTSRFGMEVRVFPLQHPN